LNTQVFDAAKHQAQPLIADARIGLEELSANLGSYKAPASWTKSAEDGFKAWMKEADAVTAASNTLPSDAQVIGAVQRALGRDISVLCAAGGLPGELHKLWQASTPSSYHLEYGFSCMGYEVAGGIGMKLAQPEREVVVMVGDGSYLMLNSELATSVMMGVKLTIVLLDNRGFGCITRLQKATGGARFNNLLADSVHESLPEIDFAAHARSLGAFAIKVSSLADLETELKKAKGSNRSTVIVIDTDPWISTEAGGHWWDVAVPEVSSRKEVDAARKKYETALKQQRIGD
ncbi:MAG: thiamine pyrophosphate-dependent enzyme, partial [Parvibaculaceae bacterium]